MQQDCLSHELEKVYSLIHCGLKDIFLLKTRQRVLEVDIAMPEGAATVSSGLTRTKVEESFAYRGKTVPSLSGSSSGKCFMMTAMRSS